ncbi:MAG TPA: hypothetical protein VFK11_01355 [Candidatus Saccharimonadales bacterium]|nr:hypothetical protein [Candidatus Saccharimonadales bacterium]
MFKHAFRLALLTLVIGLAGIFLSGNKVQAASDCSSWAPSDWWGVNYGANLHGYAGLKVHAINGATGQDIDTSVSYELHSELPNPKDNYDVPAGVNDYNAKILNEPIPGGGRDSDHWFSTEEPIYGGSSGTVYCNGWSVLGHGNNTSQGNRWVLDCSDPNVKTGNQDSTRFWISHVTTPGGAIGQNGGHWEIRLDGSTVRNNLDNGPMPKFTMVNGETRRIDLIWHPNPPNLGDDSAICENVYMKTGTAERGYVRVVDARGNVLVPNGDSGDGYGTTASGDYAVIYQEKEHTWHFKPKGQYIDVTKTRKKKNAAGDWVDEAGYPVTNRYYCYNVSCSLEILGNVSGYSDGVKQNSNFAVKATISNNAGMYGESPNVLYSGIDGAGLIFASTSAPGGIGFSQLPGPIPKDTTNNNNQRTFNFPLNAGALSVNNYGIDAKVWYNFNGSGGFQGGDWELASCHTSFKVFGYFSLNPSTSVTLSPTAEDPQTVKFDGYATPTILPSGVGTVYVDYGATSKRTLYPSGGQIPLNSNGGRKGTSHLYDYTYTRSASDPPNSAGDKYSLDPFCVSQLSGWVGPPANNPGNLFSETAGDCRSDRAYVFDRPYVHIYGADAIAGGAFKDGDTCSPSGGQTIRTYRSTIGGRSGSGAQFAALALDQISGFGSATARDSGYPHRLSFSNEAGTTSGSLGSDQPKDGGFYAGQGICSEDFYSTLKKSDATHVTAASINVNALDDNKQSYTDGDITINGGVFGKQAALFVKGDVYIRGDISYPAGKYLAIIAKGNIYIDNNVYNLDGLYVAQPKDDGTRGTIYTCAQVSLFSPNTASLYDKNDLYDNCGGNDKKQLVVNGAFAAKDVKLLRVANSLRNSCRGEYVTPTVDCPGGTKAAEVFNFSPEIYLFTPVFEENTTSDPYQYITTLPPVL